MLHAPTSEHTNRHTGRSKSPAPRWSQALRIQGELIQRKCACGGTPGPTGECAECRAKRLGSQGDFTDRVGSPMVLPLVHSVLQSPGRPLDPNTRSFMEERFGHDFSKVRVHNDTGAEKSAEALHAHAYTVGPHVVFGKGRYEPQTNVGRQLLAHELTHVVQQAAGPVPGTPVAAGVNVSSPMDRDEQAADRVAERIVSQTRNPAAEAAMPESISANQARLDGLASSMKARAAVVVQRQTTPDAGATIAGTSTDPKNLQQTDDPCSIDKIWGTWDAMKEVLCAISCSLNPFAGEKCADDCRAKYGVWTAIKECRKKHPLPPQPDPWEGTP